MALITDPEQAKRLARAILADVMLYQSAEIATQSPAVTGHIDEGRQLYRGRVTPELHEEFESALAASKLAPWGAPTSANDGGFTYRDAQQPLERPRERNSGDPPKAGPGYVNSGDPPKAGPGYVNSGDPPKAGPGYVNSAVPLFIAITVLAVASAVMAVLSR